MVVEVQQARVGANSGFFYVACLQNGKVVAHGTAVCGGKRLGDFDQHTFSMPQREVPTIPSIPQNPLMPKFTQHFEYCPTIGIPVSHVRVTWSVVAGFAPDMTVLSMYRWHCLSWMHGTHPFRWG